MNNNYNKPDKFQWDNFWETGNIDTERIDKHRLCALAMYGFAMINLPKVKAPKSFIVVIDRIAAALDIAPTQAGLKIWYLNNPTNGKVCKYMPDTRRINTKKKLG